MSRKVGIILTAIIAAIVGLWLWAGIIPKGSTSIGGSTSVDPVMQRLTNTYRKDYKGDSFIYSSSGSTGGVNNAKSGTYKIGFISRALDDSATYVNPKFKFNPNIQIQNVNDSNYKDFGTDIYNYLIEPNNYTGSQMHYVQVATDAIILTYDAPDWFKNNFSKYFDIPMTTNGVPDEWRTLIQNIYHGQYTWRKVATDIANDTSNPDLINKIQDDDADEIITPFARESGSGTRNSFDNSFGIGSNNPKDPTSPSRATEYNSNGMMYNNFRINTFGYMSLNYLGQIQGNSSLETVRVNGIDPHSEMNFMDKVNGGAVKANTYNLTRPYIGLIKWNLSKKELKKISNFLAWIATAQSEEKTQKTSEKKNAYSQYLKAGLKPEFKLDDEDDIPGAKGKPKSEKVQQVNETKVLLARTIRQGYLPRH